MICNPKGMKPCPPAPTKALLWQNAGMESASEKHSGKAKALQTLCACTAFSAMWASGFAAPAWGPDGDMLLDALAVPIFLLMSIFVSGIRRTVLRRSPLTAIGLVGISAALLTAVLPIGGCPAPMLSLLDAMAFVAAVDCSIYCVSALGYESGQRVVALSFFLGAAFWVGLGSSVADIRFEGARSALILISLLFGVAGVWLHPSGRGTLGGEEAFTGTFGWRNIKEEVPALLGAFSFAFIFGFMSEYEGGMPGEARAVINVVVAISFLVLLGVFRASFDMGVLSMVLLPVFIADLLWTSLRGIDSSGATLLLSGGYVFFWEALILYGLKESRRLRCSCYGMLLGFVFCLFLFTRIGRVCCDAMALGNHLDGAMVSAIVLLFVWLLILVAILLYFRQRRLVIERDFSLHAPVALELQAEMEQPVRHQLAVEMEPSDPYRERCEKLALTYNLSVREKEIMSEFGRGRSSSYIAEKCFLSQNTVKTYLRRIYQKLNIHSKQELLDLISAQELD